MGDRVRSLAARLPDLAPWLVLSCFAFWAAPWVATWFGVELYASWPLALLWGLVPVVAFVAMASAPSIDRKRFCAVAVFLLGSVATGVVFTTVADLDPWLVFIDGWAAGRGLLVLRWSPLGLLVEEPPWVWLVVGIAGVVAIDTHGRSGLSRDRVITRLLVAVGLLVLAASIRAIPTGGAWACFSPPSPASRAACGLAPSFDGRVLLHGAALLIAASGLRRSGDAALLAGVCAWLSARVVVDLIAGVAASAACADPVAAALALRPHAAWSLAVEWIGVATSFALVTWSLLRRAVRRRGPPPAWPVLVLMALTTSAAFDPPRTTGFPQSRPEAIWAELGVEPLRLGPTKDGQPFRRPERPYAPFLHTRVRAEPSCVLEAGGRLHVFAGGRHHVATPGEVIRTRGTVDVLVARGATLDDLRAALPHLRRASGLNLAYLRSPPGLRRRLPARRWPFVDMALRDVRARYVEVWPIDGRLARHCGVTFHEPPGVHCAEVDWRPPGSERRFVLANGIADRSLASLLVDRDDFGFVVPDGVRGDEGPRAPARGRRRPPERRVEALAIPPSAALLGLVLGLAALLLAEMEAARRAFLRGRVDARVVPAWIDPTTDVTRRGSPYREPAVSFRTAPPPRILVAALGRVARAVPRAALHLVVCALVMAIAGGAGLLVAWLAHL